MILECKVDHFDLIVYFVKDTDDFVTVSNCSSFIFVLPMEMGSVCSKLLESCWILK